MSLLRQAIAINDEHVATVATVASNSGDATTLLVVSRGLRYCESAAVCYYRNVTLPRLVVIPVGLLGSMYRHG